jgi:carbon monoxide dehydrogenase subunit G
MKIEEEFEVASSIEHLYGELNDVGEIGYCIAGVKDVQVIDADHSRWKIEQRFGAIARTFDLQAEISERQPPERILFEARGQDVEINGSVQLERVSDEQTRCAIVIDVNAIGALVPLLEIFAKGPQRALIRKTVSNIRQRLEGVTPDAAPAESSRLRRWLRRFFRRGVE